MTQQVDLQRPSSRRSRVAAFDLARGLALLFIVMLHVMAAHGAPEVWRTPFAMVVGFLGSVPSAPVFMFLMGASQAFSRRATVGKGIRRGIELLLLGYLLNFLRGTLPIILATRVGILSLEEIAPRTATSEFWIVDILQFAGTALIVMSLVRRFLPKPYQWLLLSVLVAVSAPLLWGRMTGWPVLDWLLSLFWGTDRYVIHTIFPWLSYSLVGMAFGAWVSGSDRHHRLFGWGILVGACLAAVAAWLRYEDPQFPGGGYPDARPVIVVWVIAVVLVWVGMCHILTSSIRPNRVFGLLFYWSKNVTTFYFIQWLLIYWAVLVIGLRQRSLPETILSMVVVLMLTDQATRLWVRGRRSFSERVRHSRGLQFVPQQHFDGIVSAPERSDRAGDS